ncbi:hypothetical protein HY733_00560 [Candidatus Uhrbacteria bacterium]|nr:hypothetical protein [Candidatus Uhrbacteria bacterium]
MSAHSSAVDSPRPIQVHSYPPTPAGAKPQLPDTLIQMFLHELSTEPHHNPFSCDKCGREYTLAVRSEGTTCTARPEGGFVCQGKITRRWTKQKAQMELLRLMALGCVAIAWELTESSVPVGFIACESYSTKVVMDRIDFPPRTLEVVYGQLGREEPFLVITHLWVASVFHEQIDLLVQNLIKDAVEGVMRQCSLSRATVLVPISTREEEVRRRAFQVMLGTQFKPLVRDARSQHHRDLLGFQFQVC